MDHVSVGHLLLSVGKKRLPYTLQSKQRLPSHIAFLCLFISFLPSPFPFLPACLLPHSSPSCLLPSFHLGKICKVLGLELSFPSYGVSLLHENCILHIRRLDWSSFPLLVFFLLCFFSITFSPWWRR